MDFQVLETEDPHCLPALGVAGTLPSSRHPDGLPAPTLRPLQPMSVHLVLFP